MHPAGEPQLFLVAQILDRGVDVAVEPQIADLDIGLVAADGQVDLVAAEREIVLVDPEAVGEVDQPAEADAGAADDVGEAVGKPGAVRENARLARSSR